MINDKYKPGDLVKYSQYIQERWKDKPVIIIEGRESLEYPTYKIYDIYNKLLSWETENMLISFD